MYTPEGDRIVAELIQELKEDLKNISLLHVRRKLSIRTKEISKIHGEIYDSEVRDTIYWELTEYTKDLHGISLDLHTSFWDI